MSFAFDVYAMYWGSEDIVRPDTGATVDGSVNLTDSNDAAEIKYGIAGIQDYVGVGLILPAVQSDGSTATTGTLTLTLKTYRKNGTTLLDTVTRQYTLGTAQQDFVRVAPSAGAHVLGVAVTISASGNAGVSTIGLAMGGPRQHAGDANGNG